MTHTPPIPNQPPALAVRLPAIRTGGIALAVLSAFAFSFSGPLVKPLLEAGWSLSAALVIRIGVAGLVLSPALVRTLRAQPGFLRRHWLSLCAFGLFTVAGCQLLYFSAMQRMPVAVALLIQYLAPVLLVVFFWARTRIAPSRTVLLGTLVAMVGLVLVVDVAGARFDALGTLFALGAAVCVCVYFVMSERTGPDLPPLALASGGLIAGALMVALLGVTSVLPIAAPDVTVAVRGVEMPGIVPLLFVGGVAPTLGYALGILAVGGGPARAASV